MSAGADQIVLRPSRCPHHALIYRSRQRSHRELPVRLAELAVSSVQRHPASWAA